ncbi:uncharacterized protein JCM15063_000192 [Sporobolomyces koalae]|uniref:uncharacterized protein n=1 Tax=Sporobolomyces koalae TaxID=500713 RepID=UPI00316BC284
MASVKKGNYKRRKRSPDPEPVPGPSSSRYAPSAAPASMTPSTKNAQDAVSGAAATPTADPNRIQFEQQEDFIGFDFSDPEDSAPASRDHRSGPGGAKRKHQNHDDDDRQEQGTRQLRKREKERSTPWCEDPGVRWSKYDNATAQLNAEAKSFVSYISPTPIEHELRMYTIEIIRRTIKSKYADADVQCFGSVGTGLYLPGGDIDLVVLCPSMPSPPLKPSSSLLHRLASLLLTSSIAQPSSLVVIAKARVPIVKFTTRYGGFAVDLSVNQKNGVDAAVRVRGMLEDFAFREEGYVEPGATANGISIKGSSSNANTDSTTKKGKEKEPRPEQDEQVATVDHGVARSLVLLVKAFLAQRGMNEVFTGGLGSYSIICLVISFLQLHPKIQSAQIQPARNVGLLFLEFLEYYGKHFNFDETGITLKARGGYFNKHDKGWFRSNQPYLLSIEDPNDPSNDVSGGSHNIIRVRQTLAGGFDTLSATLLQRQSHLSAKRNPSLIPLSTESLPNADSDPPSSGTRSLLGSIVGMTRAGVDARRTNLRLWDDGVLQRILERISGSSGTEGEGMSGKALKKLRKEERDREKRERTIAKLERRMEEKEKKAQRKKDKKRKLAADEHDDDEQVRAEPVTSKTDSSAVEAAKAAAASLKGLAGPDEDSEFSARSRSRSAPVDNEEEEEESRYSLGVPSAASKKNRATSPRPVVQYTSQASSDSSDDDDAGPDSSAQGDNDDDDVVLGGGGGDFVRFDSAQHSEEDDDSENSSSDEVMQSLVPSNITSRLQINGAATAAASTTAATKGGRKEGPPSKKKKTKDSKSAARIAFWGAKGPKE